MSSFPDNEFSESIFEKEDLIEGFNSHMFYDIAINNFSVSF